MTALQTLAKLEHLKSIFDTLIRGRHLNRLHDGPWWNELEAEQETYEGLFALLGFSLRVDPRGFAWFHNNEPAANIANKTRTLALLMLALFERQADKGMNLASFHEWRLDQALLEELLQDGRATLEAEGLGSIDAMVAAMGTAVAYSFAAKEGPDRWRLLPATWRYLDAFDALARDHESSTDVLAADEP